MNNKTNEMNIKIIPEVRQGYLYLKPEVELDNEWAPLFFIDGSRVRFQYSTRKSIQSVYQFVSSDELDNIVRRIFKKYTNLTYADDAFVFGAKHSITHEQLLLEKKIHELYKRISALNSQREQPLTVHQFQCLLH